MSDDDDFADVLKNLTSDPAAADALAAVAAKAGKPSRTEFAELDAFVDGALALDLDVLTARRRS